MISTFMPWTPSCALDTNATRADVEGAMAGHVVGKAVMQTRFKR